MKKIINWIKRKFNLPIWWYHCNIYKTAVIGKGTTIGSFCEIGDLVFIGKNCKIEAFVFIPKGVIIEDDCFIGPGVVFTNDKYPPSGTWQPTIVQKGARIGANCTILPGVTIGEGALVGGGSVVTKDITNNSINYGNPARPKN